VTADAAPPVPPDPLDAPQPAPQPTNGLGLAGFIVSLVGLVPCGLGCPVGLVLSLVALRKEPRGFAIAGAVIGAVGSMMAVVVGVWAYLTWSAVSGTSRGKGLEMPAPEETQPVRTFLVLTEAEQAIQLEQVDKGRLPSPVKGNEIIEELRDGWGHALRYEPHGESFTIRSAGPDGVFGTADDETTDGR
jgi:hypothetical protein